MTPYQNVVQWPAPVKRKCFQMYMQNYTAPQIEKATGVPASTIYDWSRRTHRGKSWSSIRRATVTDYEEEARSVIGTAIQGLDKAVKASCRILDHLEGTLGHGSDAPTPPRPPYGALESKCQSSEVTPPQSPLEPKDLESLANALASVSSVLLRVFGK